MIRESMLYHVDRFPDPGVKARQARLFLQFLAGVLSSHNDAFSEMLRLELTALARKDDFYLLHDHLEEDNDPVYFHQFMEHAEEHGLQYLCEAEFHRMPPSDFAVLVPAQLGAAALDTTGLEQYFDFVRTTRLRQTLLVHDHAAVHRPPSWTALRKLRIASDARPVSIAQNLRSQTAEEFRTSQHASIAAIQPITKVMLIVLSEVWPRSLPFGELCELAAARLNASDLHDARGQSDREATIGLFLLEAYGSAVEDN
jgi:hypothetical protein